MQERKRNSSKKVNVDEQSSKCEVVFSLLLPSTDLLHFSVSSALIVGIETTGKNRFSTFYGFSEWRKFYSISILIHFGKTFQSKHNHRRDN